MQKHGRISDSVSRSLPSSRDTSPMRSIAERQAFFEGFSPKFGSPIETKLHSCQPKRDKNVQLIKINTEDGLDYGSISKKNYENKKPVICSFVEAFGKSSANQQRDDKHSSEEIISDESDPVTHKTRSQIVPIYPDHVTRFSKPSPAQCHDFSKDCVDKNEEISATLDAWNEQKTVEMTETNDITLKQHRSLFVKSISSFDAKLAGEVDRSLSDITASNRSSTSLPSDKHKRTRIARRVPVNRLRKVSYSSSAFTSSSSDSESSTGHHEAKLLDSKIDNANSIESDLIKCLPRRARARHRNKETANSLASNLSVKAGQAVSINSKTQLEEKQEEDCKLEEKNESKENVKCYSVSRSIQISKSYRNKTSIRKPGYVESFNKYATLPADFQPVATSVSVARKPLNVSQTSIQNAGRLTRVGERTGTEDRLIIKKEHTASSKDDSEKKNDIVKQNSANQSDKTTPVITNQNQQTSYNGGENCTVENSSKFEKTTAIEAESEPISELRSFKPVQSRKLRLARKVYITPSEVDYVKETHEDFSQAVQSQPLVKAKRVSVSYWPRDKTTEELLTRTVRSKESSELLSSVDNTMHSNTGGKPDSKILLQATKETNLSDPIEKTVLSAFSPISQNQSNSNSLKNQQTIINNRINSRGFTEIRRANLLSNGRVKTLEDFDSTSEKTNTNFSNYATGVESRGRFSINNVDNLNDKSNNIDSNRYSDDNKPRDIEFTDMRTQHVLTDGKESNSRNPENIRSDDRRLSGKGSFKKASSVDNGDLNINESTPVVYPTTYVSARKSSLVSCSKALPLKSFPTHEDGDGYIEQTPSLRSVSDASSTAKWHQKYSNSNIRTSDSSNSSDAFSPVQNNSSVRSTVGAQHQRSSIDTDNKQMNSVANDRQSAGSDSSESSDSSTSLQEDVVSSRAGCHRNHQPSQNANQSSDRNATSVMQNTNSSEQNLSYNYLSEQTSSEHDQSASVDDVENSRRGRFVRNKLPSEPKSGSHRRKKTKPLARATKTFRVKERKQGEFNVGEDVGFKPIRLDHQSEDSPDDSDYISSPTGKFPSSMDYQLDLNQAEKHFHSVLETFSNAKENDKAVLSRSMSESTDDLDTVTSQKHPEKSRRAGVVKQSLGSDIASNLSSSQQINRSIDRVLPATLPRSNATRSFKEYLEERKKLVSLHLVKELCAAYEMCIKIYRRRKKSMYFYYL